MATCALFMVALVVLVVSAAAAAALDAGTQLEQVGHENLASYIVHVSVRQRPAIFASSVHWYASVLASVSGLPLRRSLQVHGPFYSYQSVFHGFAAKLTPSLASRLLQIPGFLHAFPDKLLHLHTTHTPAFLHLSDLDGLWPSSAFGQNVIVGVIDTGIWPERQSFSAVGLDSVPARWKGECENASTFNASLCNAKLIGARAFYRGYEAAYGPIDETSEYKSARDSEGHGTHTSSTAAGAFVANASLFGYAPGDARGMASSARIAMYKVCWEPGCYDSDIIAGFDAAVADGVDVISLSVGGSVVPFFEDSIAISSFAAMEKGIFVSCSAGNSGPYAGSVTNVAPWVVTVAASSVDRTFPAPIFLGDGSSYNGLSVYPGEGWSDGEQLPLIYAGDAALNGSSKAYLCISGTLDPGLVNGKIVLCERGSNARVSKGSVVAKAGGAAMILANSADSGTELIADCHLLPASVVGFKEGIAIKAYIAAQGSNATASIIFNGTELGVRPAPVIAAFSSRGPNPLPAQILKPDITAPGVNILAAYTGATGPTGLDSDDRIVDFSIMSGTSMSCPHVSGLAALLKGAHPDWSPSAIKSALMTTALNTDNTGTPLIDGVDAELAEPFSYGAGHVNPQAALDAGLVYDLGVQDYVDFLCSLGYKGDDLEVFTKGVYNCSRTDFSLGDLNYPSFSLVFEGGSEQSFTFTRILTNVGDANATYTVDVSAPQGVDVTVVPERLEFGKINEKLSYSVTFQTTAIAFSSISPEQQQHAFGSLTWTDGIHVVTSPIAVIFSSKLSQTTLLLSAL